MMRTNYWIWTGLTIFLLAVEISPAQEQSDKKQDQGLGSFEQKLEVVDSATGTIEVEISYQVCNQQYCLPPTTVTKTITVGNR